MDIQNLKDILIQLERLISDQHRIVADLEKEAQEIEGATDQIKIELASELAKAARAESESSFVVTQTEALERMYESKQDEKKQEAEAAAQQIKEAQDQLNEMEEVLKELNKHDSHLSSYKPTVDDWMDKAEQVIRNGR